MAVRAVFSNTTLFFTEEKLAWDLLNISSGWLL